ncbi:MAG: amino acid ABC transporter permease [Thermodesulfobacteriota bacterium]
MNSREREGGPLASVRDTAMICRRLVKRYGGNLLFLGTLFSVGFIGYHRLQYNWQWYRIPEYLFTVENGKIVTGMLLDGLTVTLTISSLGLLLAMGIGVVTALMRLSASPILRLLAVCYVELVRNTPLLIQLFVMYFVISPVLGLSPFVSALAALCLFEGAYASEIIRAGIISLPRGQWEAGLSLGMSVFDIYRDIVVPQVMPQILPMLAGQSVSLIKDSALVSTISIFDLTMQGRRIVSDTFLTFEIWFTVAFCYFLLTAPLALMIARLEKRFGIHE